MEVVMTAGKATVLGLGFVSAIALGVAIGATMDDKWPRWTTTNTQATAESPTVEPAAVQPKAKAEKRAARPVAEARRNTAPKTLPPGAVSTVAVGMWEPELRERAKSILNRGTKLEIAAQDFDTAEEFMTVAHAAHNTAVPFVVLKHRVLNENQSLAEAIEQSKPELDAKAEVERAKAAAKADVAA
jgi:hypothetical protein